MNALTILASSAVRRTPSKRNFVSMTTPWHGKHHQHMTFDTSDTKKFGKGVSALITFGSVIAGTGLMIFAVRFQQKKHGYW
jgi:hypothetical protein